ADCATFIEALAAAEGRKLSRKPAGLLREGAGKSRTGLPQINQALGDLVREAAGRAQVRQFGAQRYVIWPGERAEHHCFVRLVPGTIGLKLDGFRLQSGARLVRSDAKSFVYEIPMRGSLLQRWLSRSPALQVEVRLLSDPDAKSLLATLGVVLRPINCS